MSDPLEKTFPRLWSLTAGVAMVVTDLHGDWDAYRRYRDRFVDLQATGRADHLILTGDLIHRETVGWPDHSLKIVLDVLALRETYGPSIIYLCGNHEMPHLYGISLGRGNRLYTPDFEAALSRSGRRAEVIALFDSLPFYVRTQAGVSLTHAGAAAPLVEPENLAAILSWDHQQLLSQAEAILQQEDVAALRRGYAKYHQSSYENLAEYYLAVSGPDDSRYNDLLRGFIIGNLPPFEKILWPALFTRCEEAYDPANYAIFLETLLQEFSADFYPQRFLVAGHMSISGGHQVVVDRHLRLASARHAKPREAGQYLLFDAGQPIRQMSAVLSGLGTVYKQ